MQRGGIQFMLEPSVHAKYPFMVLHSFPFLVVLVVNDRPRARAPSSHSTKSVVT
jgi:hypothetical protein